MPVERNVISPEQKEHIQGIVIGINSVQGIHYATTYRKIKKQFNVNSYHELTQDQYPLVCKSLGAEPKYVEGELLPLNKEALPINTPYASLPSPENAYLKETRDRVSNLRQWALENHHNGVADDLDVIECCLVS